MPSSRFTGALEQFVSETLFIILPVVLVDLSSRRHDQIIALTADTCM